MPQVTDLMAAGMSWPLAQGLGNTAVTISAAGATVAAATTIQPNSNIVYVSTTTGAAAVAFSTAWSLGTPVYVAITATAAVSGTVCPPSGGLMNGSTNGTVTMSTGKTAVFIQTTATRWVSIPLAPG